MRHKVAGLLVVMLAGCGSGPQARQGRMALPPVPVSIGSAVRQAVPIQVRAVGNVEPYSSVQIKAQVSGALLSVKFTEGTNVSRGDLLFVIDPRPFRSALRPSGAGAS